MRIAVYGLPCWLKQLSMEDRPMELILIHVLLHPLNPLYFYVSEIIDRTA